MLYLNVTTHVDGDADQDLLGEKGGNGFPYLVMMDAEGKLVAKHDWPKPRTVEGFEGTLKDAQAFVELRAKGAGGDAAAALEAFMKDLEFGNLKVAEAKEQAGKLKDVTEEQKGKIATLLADAEVREALAAMSKNLKGIEGETDQEKVQAALKKEKLAAAKGFLEMKKAGRLPSHEDTLQPFYIFMLDLAEEQKDAALFEECLAPLKEKFGGNPNAKRFFDMQNERLEKLKAAK